MDEQGCLSKMVAPRDKRATAYMRGIQQILVTPSCNLRCGACTQGSQLKGRNQYMSLDDFEAAVISLKNYFGVVGVFGGNPAMHPQFEDICAVMRQHLPLERRGLWCNDPLTESKGRAAAATFHPGHCNLNCHELQAAADRFKKWWPESQPFGYDERWEPSRHAPVHGSMIELGVPEAERWDKISRCSINQYWSGITAVWRGELRGWMCEVMASQSLIKEHDPNWPDTGFNPRYLYDKENSTIKVAKADNPVGDKWVEWWGLSIQDFANQIRFHCHNCLVPMNGAKQLASDSQFVELTTPMYAQELSNAKSKNSTVQVFDDYRNFPASDQPLTKYIKRLK